MAAGGVEYDPAPGQDRVQKGSVTTDRLGTKEPPMGFDFGPNLTRGHWT